MEKAAAQYHLYSRYICSEHHDCVQFLKFLVEHNNRYGLAHSNFIDPDNNNYHFQPSLVFKTYAAQ